MRINLIELTKEEQRKLGLPAEALMETDCEERCMILAAASKRIPRHLAQRFSDDQEFPPTVVVVSS
jgi:hypothetical protein